MDVSGLIIEAYNRRQNHLDRRQAYLQEKKKKLLLLQQKEKEMAQRVAQQKAQEKAIAEAKVKAEAEAKARVKAELEAKALAAQKALKPLNMFPRGGHEELLPSTNGRNGVRPWKEEAKSIRMHGHLEGGGRYLEEVVVPTSGLNHLTKMHVAKPQIAATVQGDLNLQKESQTASKSKTFSSGVASSNGRSQPGIERLSQIGLDQDLHSNMIVNSMRRQPEASNGGTIVQEHAFGGRSHSIMQSSPTERLRGFPQETSPFEGKQLPGTMIFQQNSQGIHNNGTDYAMSQNMHGTNPLQANVVNQAWFGRENQFMPDNGQNVIQQQLLHMNMAQSFSGPHLGNMSTQLYQIQQQMTAFPNTPFGYSTYMSQPVEFQQQEGHGMISPHSHPAQPSYQNRVPSSVSQGQQIQQEQNIQMLQSELHRLQQLRQLQQLQQQQQQQQQQSQFHGFPPSNQYW